MKTLRQLRIEKGETLVQVAEALNTGPASVSAWELGQSTPQPRFIPMIAEHFGITAQESREIVEALRKEKQATEAASK